MSEERVFLVHVWRQPGGFRAAVRDVVQEQPLWFDEAAALARFLAGAGPPALAQEAAAPHPADAGPAQR